MKFNISAAAFLVLCIVTCLCSCNTKARLTKKSSLYVWTNGKGITKDKLVKMTTGDKRQTVKITENTGYLSIVPEDTSFVRLSLPYGKTLTIQPVPAGFRTDVKGMAYYPEVKFDTLSEQAYLKYTQVKFGLQAMTVLLKWRGGIPADKVPELPRTVETGTSLGLSYGISQTWNEYRSTKNFFGSNITTYSVTAGPMIGVSAVELKTATNAPGLGLDRKSPAISYGGYVMFGTGPINIGYAIGADHVLGYGASKWVYGGKVWHGLIFGLKVLTF